MIKVLYRENKKEQWKDGYLITISKGGTSAIAYIASIEGLVVQIFDTKFKDCLRIDTPEHPLT